MTRQPPLSQGELLLDALEARNFAALRDCLDTDVRFRVLLPSGPAEMGRDEAVDRFRAWFGGPDTMEVVDAAADGIGEAVHLRWRVRLTAADGTSRLVEQHAFARGDHRLTRVELLCSGFVRGGREDLDRPDDRRADAERTTAMTAEGSAAAGHRGALGQFTRRTDRSFPSHLPNRSAS